MRTFLILFFALVFGGGRGRCGETSGASSIASPIALPVVGTFGVVPSGAEAIRVQVDARGRIVAGGRGPLSLSQLEEEVERQAGDAGWVAEDGSSRKVVVLEADASLPWATTVWIVDAAFSGGPQPQEVYFVAQAGMDGARGALGWRLPGEATSRSAALPWTAAVLDLQDGPGDGREDLLLVLRDAQQRAAASGETRLEILAPRSGSPGMPTGFVLGVFDLALRTGVTDVVFEGNDALPARRRQSLEWLLEKTAGLRREKGSPRIRVVGMEIDPAVEGAEPLQAQGVLPHRYGLDVVRAGGPPRSRIRGRPGFYGTAAKAGEQALQWLADQQSDDGSWAAAKPGYEIAATSLALLAFLRHGYTHRGRHAFAKVVARGLRFLKGHQREDGLFGVSSATPALYGHAVATLALAEAFGQTGSPIFEKSLQGGLDAIAGLREPAGLWTPDAEEPRLDSWMALPIARAAATLREEAARGRVLKLGLDAETLAAVRGWIGRHREEGGAIRLRVLLGERLGESQSLRAALDRHGRRLPDRGAKAWDLVDLAHGLDAFRPAAAGGLRSSWTLWGGWRPVAAALLARQRWDDASSGLRGSWDPWGGACFGGGRVVATALAARSLAPYGHVVLRAAAPQRRFGD